MAGLFSKSGNCGAQFWPKNIDERSNCGTSRAYQKQMENTKCSRGPEVAVSHKSLFVSGDFWTWMSFLPKTHYQDVLCELIELIKRSWIRPALTCIRIWNKTGLATVQSSSWCAHPRVAIKCNCSVHYYLFLPFLLNLHTQCGGPGSSVGIATDYGLDGPGSNPGGDKIFRQYRPTLGPTQPLVKWVPGLSRRCAWGVLLDTHPHLVPRSWNSIAIPLPTLWATPGL